MRSDFHSAPNHWTTNTINSTSARLHFEHVSAAVTRLHDSRFAPRHSEGPVSRKNRFVFQYILRLCDYGFQYQHSLKHNSI